MKLKGIAWLAFLLNTVLFGTYYAVSKEALGRIDPIVFTFFEMTSLVPPALCILALSRKQVTWAVVKRGVILGSTLCLALFTIAIALKYTSATSTAFFPALNGFLAAIIAWAFLKQPLKKATWGAGILSIVGATLLILNSPMGGVRGSLIAFLGGLFFTCYVFLSDNGQQHEIAPWPLFGIELLTMAGWACLVALLFGDWQAFHPTFPKDIWVVLYVAGACTFLPTLFTVLLQKHVSPLTVSFIYVLEPVIGAVLANLYLHEILPLVGYIGGGLVFAGSIIQTWGSVGTGQRSVVTRTRTRELWLRRQVMGIETAIYPLLFLFAGGFLLIKLGGLPPTSWRVLATAHVQLLTSTQLWGDAAIQLTLAQAACWLVAWVAVAIIGGIGIVRGLRGPERQAMEAVREATAFYGPLLSDTDLHVWVKQPAAERTRITEDLTESIPTMPMVQLWEEYPELPLAVASYEPLALPPARKHEAFVQLEQRPRMRRQRLVAATALPQLEAREQ